MAGSGTRTIDPQHAQQLANWVLNDINQNIMSPGASAGASAGSGGKSMSNVNQNDLQKLGQQIYDACNQFNTSGNFPNYVNTGSNVGTQGGYSQQNKSSGTNP